MSETLKIELSKKAGSLLTMIDRGQINVNEIKGFLAKVEKLSSPRRKSKKEVRKNEIRAMIK